MPGNTVPAMSSEIKEALKDPRFGHLKMSEHTFQCYLGLWRGININSPEDLHFPIPPLAGTLPLKVAMWNNLKDGGDNLTKLADICQERIGVRSENLVACTRILLNIGLVFHCCNYPRICPSTHRYCTAGIRLTTDSLQTTR